MKANVLISMTLLCVAMQVCAAPPTGTRKIGSQVVEKPCVPSNTEYECYIDVVVKDIKEGEKVVACEVSVDDSQDSVGFRKGVQGKFIYWLIVGPAPGYEFVADGGIEFTDQRKPKSFPDPVPVPEEGTKKNTGFKVKNKNLKRGVFEYVIDVFNPDTGVECILDPWIRNQ